MRFLHDQYRSHRIYGTSARFVTRSAAVAVMLLASTRAIDAQASSDSVARLRVVVQHEGAPVEGVVVRVGSVALQTNASGAATLSLAAGLHAVIATRLGLVPDTLSITLRAAQDTTVTMSLEAAVSTIEAMVVSATRGERRVEDVPLRVEVIDEEEIAEKVAMTPGDIAMMLNETAGLRVQTTSPSLGGANVRIQGLLGRYSLILADGLPLYGGQAGGLGLLQIPPVDLGRVEVIKGTASALYGSAALGGVVNLVSRRPGDAPEHTALINQTSRGGTDGVAFLTAPLSERWGYTMLLGAHRQSRRDIDGDGWTDLPGYERGVIRPRLYYDNGAGRTAFLTAGFTGEDRKGGTLEGRVAPDGRSFDEGLNTRRADIGGLTRWLVSDSASALHGAIVTLRGSAVEQRHRHAIGEVREVDRHRTWFGEAAVVVPREPATWVAGMAFQQDSYVAKDVAGFDYSFFVPAVFAQLDVDASSWLSLSASVRGDSHSEYGTAVNPRVSVLLRRPLEGTLAGWTSRLSAGRGEFAPTPFTDETEVTGLAPLQPLRGLVAERATSASFDVGGPVALGDARLEINATVFASRVTAPVQVLDLADAFPEPQAGILLSNAPGPTRTWGAELLARYVRELGEPSPEREEPSAFRLTGTWTYLRSTECGPHVLHLVGCLRREVPLTPRQAAGVVASIEREGVSRLGLEVYYTGRQSLDENPYRTESKPYVILGLLGERAFTTAAGTARLFVNLENLTNVRQTRYDPLVLPARGLGGRWTTDAWTELAGFTMNGGVRLAF